MITPTPKNAENPVKSWIETAQSLFTLLRDFSIFGVIGALVAVPGCMGQRLSDAGITQIDAGFVEWKAQTEDAQKSATLAADSLDSIKSKNEELVQKLTNLEKLADKSDDTKLAAAVSSIRTEARNTSLTLDAASEKLTTSIAVQDSALRQANSNVVERTGWIYLGKVDATKSKWAGDMKSNASWPVSPGTVIKLNTDVYLRADSAAGKRSEAEIFGGLTNGETVKILKIDADRKLKSDGFAVWAQVNIP